MAKVGRCWQSVLCQAEKFGGWKTKNYGEKNFEKNPAVFCELAKICRNFSLFTKSVKGANWCFVFRYHLPLIAVSSIKRKRSCNHQREEITISTKDDFLSGLFTSQQLSFATFAVEKVQRQRGQLFFFPSLNSKKYYRKAIISRWVNAFILNFEFSCYVLVFWRLLIDDWNKN